MTITQNSGLAIELRDKILEYSFREKYHTLIDEIAEQTAITLAQTDRDKISQRKLKNNPDFDPLISDIKQQTSSSERKTNKIYIKNKYLWLPETQIQSLEEQEKNGTTGMVRESQLQILDKHLISFIENNSKLSKSNKGKICLIDCGVGNKVVPYGLFSSIKEISSLFYFGIDYSESIIKKAKIHLTREGFREHEFLEYDFETIGKSPEILFETIRKNHPASTKIYFLTGGTYGSLSYDDIRLFLSNVLKPGDFFAIDVRRQTPQQLNNPDWPVTDPGKIHFVGATLRELGFLDCDWEGKYEFNHENDYLEANVKLNYIPEYSQAVKKCGLKKDDVVCLAFNRIISKEQFEKEMNGLSRQVELLLIDYEDEHKNPMCMAFGYIKE